MTKPPLMSDAIPSPNKGGRPKIARGAATTSADAGPAWSIRGVPANVREMASKAAAAHGLTMGDWVSEAIVRYARGDRGEPGAENSGKPEIPNLPALVEPPIGELEARLARAVDALERQLPKPWQRRRRW